MEYRKKIISGFAWSAGEKFATSAVRVIATVSVLRFIDPGQFGVVSLLSVFSYIAYTIIDSGFSQALIRKRDAGSNDYNSIFYLNVGIAVLLYILLVGLSFPLSVFFRQPDLITYAPVLFLSLPLTALGLIQTTLLSKKMDFRTLSKALFTATVVSSTIMIILAAMGYGPWALIWQAVANEAAKTIYLWLYGRWRPERIFSMESIRSLFPFGSRLLLSGIINQIFHKATNVIIGRLYSPVQVGLYDRSLSFKDTIANALSISLYNVSYPALASFQDDEQKLRLATRQIVQVLSFILFPVMGGLILVSAEGFAIAGGEKWIPAVPYFRIFCLSALFLPLTNAGMNILRSKGLGNTILKAEFIKKSFAAAVITAAALFDVKALVWGYTLWMGFEMCVNSYYAKKASGYGFHQQMSDIIPYLLMSLVMAVAVIGMTLVAVNLKPVFFDGRSSESILFLMGVKVITGGAVYILLGAFFKPAAWKETTTILKSIKHRR